MHSLDPLQNYAHQYAQRLVDEAAHEALVAALPHQPSPFATTLTRRYLAGALRGLASRLDPPSLPLPGIARPR